MIEPVTLSDLDEVRAVIAAAVRESVANTEEDYAFLIGDIENSLTWWQANPAQSIHLQFVIENQIVGVVLVKNGWNLTNLFVHPNFYGQGVATKLLHKVIDECASISPKKELRLNSSTFAVPFYEKFGFRRNGEAVDRPGGCVPMTYEFK